MRNNGFAFDTWGFLTVENALTPEQVTANRPVDGGASCEQRQRATQAGYST